MCGFVFTNDKQVKEQKVRDALKSIFHRGPDDVKFVSTASAWMGFSRLAIMDLSHDGDQTFKYDNKFFMCNGEIYNYESLKSEVVFDFQSKSDCEILIPLFLK